nr:MAG TPA: hypothetical protein [Caudoviricetes sp.]
MHCILIKKKPRKGLCFILVVVVVVASSEKGYEPRNILH